MIELSNIFESAQILVQNNESFELLKKDFPEILADLVSYKNNPNCSCRNRVNKFFSEKITSNPTILDQYVWDEEEFNKLLEAATELKRANNYSGRVLTIEKSEQSWADFVKTLDGKSFRIFSVVERENNLVIYFA